MSTFTTLDIDTDSQKLEAAALEQENDLGNGRRFAHYYSDIVRYTPEMDWLLWDGTCWKPDQLAADKLAPGVVDAIFREVEVIRTDPNADLVSRVKWAKRSGDINRISGMIRCAKSEPRITVRSADFDSDPYLLNCLNGTIDLRTGTLREHRREDLITNVCPVNYDPQASFSVWDKFLAETTGGDRELSDFLARAAGLSLSGCMDEEVYFLVHGPTNSGKGTFVEALRSIIGTYGASADFETFLQRKDVSRPRPDIARLAFKRFVVAQEADEKAKLDVARLKTMTGRDKQTARFLFKSDFEFVPQWSIWLVSNHRPEIRNDAAIWRRVVEIPFSRTVPTEQRDHSIKTQLTDPGLAGPAILAWAVRGYLDWQANGLRAPDSVTKATQDYQTSQDIVKKFLDECCELNPTAWTSSSCLKDAFDKWARDNGERTISAKMLAARFQAHGLEPKQVGTSRTRGFIGVELFDAPNSYNKPLS